MRQFEVAEVYSSKNGRLKMRTLGIIESVESRNYRFISGLTCRVVDQFACGMSGCGESDKEYIPDLLLSSFSPVLMFRSATPLEVASFWI